MRIPVRKALLLHPLGGRARAPPPHLDLEVAGPPVIRTTSIMGALHSPSFKRDGFGEEFSLRTFQGFKPSLQQHISWHSHDEQGHHLFRR
jgi:hypothetical protein